MVWAVPILLEIIEVIPIPIFRSELNLLTASFEIEFCVSSTNTFPITLCSAKQEV